MLTACCTSARMDFSDHLFDADRSKSSTPIQYDSGRSSKRNDNVSRTSRTTTCSEHVDFVDNDDDYYNEYKNYDFDKAPVCVQNSLVIAGNCHVKAYVSHINHISAFFVQLPSSQLKFQQLQIQMKQEYNLKCFVIATKHCLLFSECYLKHAIKETLSLHQGDYCVAQYSQDKIFYRGRILDIKKNPEIEYEVVFIDFGNSEWMRKENIRPMFKEFSFLPAQAIPCTLSKVMPLNSDRPTWLSDKGKQAVQIFKNLIFDKYVDVTFLPNTDFWSLCFVKIVDENGQDIRDFLIQQNLVKATKGNTDLSAELNLLFTKRDYIMYAIPYEGDGYDNFDM
ncbi:unnamed protein product [Didymodactylos carnosus]|uniref:Tudor domain-containing protein n=1 Tax=Didymodactylos carnosus TaxID=1234261 RepID=A0A814I222_9BILA|nr:unnamed protein product [Didymodactylos carnosus]CAF3789229.1 unnamed protein product [Didymodactylos carnosus]